MLFELDPMILDLNRKLLEKIEVFKPTKIVLTIQKEQRMN